MVTQVPLRDTSPAMRGFFRQMAPHPEAYEPPYIHCATCGGGLCADDFRDTLSLKEASISRTCQPCQDVIFSPDSEES